MRMEGEGEEEETVLIADGVRRRDVPSCCCFTRMEIIFMVAVTILAMGGTFAIELPSSLQNAITQYYSLSQHQFSLLYTFYYAPSMLLSIFGGYLIDKVLGVRLSTIIYCLIAAFGLVLFVSGGALNLFWLMVLGRFVFGLGNELGGCVCLNYCTFTYFNRSSVNFMFSLTDNMCSLGTLAVFQLAPYLFNLFSEHQTPHQSLNLVLIICSSTYVVTAAISIWISFMGESNVSEATTDTNNTNQSSHLKFSDLLQIPAIFWLLCVSFCLFGNAIYTFETFSQGLFTSNLYNMTVGEASNAVTIMNGVKTVMSFPFSIIVDMIGRNLQFVVVSMILSTMSFVMLIQTFVHPYFSMALMGFAYSMTGSSIWSLFAYPISQHLRGSGYGVVSAVGSLSQTVSPFIFGILVDRFGYMAALYYSLVNASVAVVIILMTWVLDYRSGSILSLSPQERVQRNLECSRLEVEVEEDAINHDWYEPLSSNSGVQP